MGTWLCSFQGKPPVPLSPWGPSRVCWVGALSAWFGSKGNGRGLLSSLGLRKDAERSLGLGPAPSGLVEGPFFGGWMAGDSVAGEMPGLWWPQGLGPALVRGGWEGSLQRHMGGCCQGADGMWSGQGESWPP